MKSHSTLRPKGHVEWTDPDGHEHGGDTLQCVHCGRHWRVHPGSGRVRGFCFKCNGPTCHNEGCSTICQPVEKKLELWERGGVTLPSGIVVLSS